MQKELKQLTERVRKMKGSGEALRFYTYYIQPIKDYLEKNVNSNGMCGDTTLECKFRINGKCYNPDNCSLKIK